MKLTKYKADLLELRQKFQRTLDLYLEQSQKEKLFNARSADVIYS